MDIKETVREELKKFTKQANKKGNLNDLFGYLLLTSKFEQTFRDLFAFHLKKKFGKKGDYLVARECGRADIVIFSGTEPKLIIELKHGCSFDYNKGVLSSYVKRMGRQLKQYADDIKSDVPCMGIFLVSHLGNINKDDFPKEYKKYIKYLLGFKSKNAADKEIINSLKKGRIQDTEFDKTGIIKGGIQVFDNGKKITPELLVLSKEF